MNTRGKMGVVGFVIATIASLLLGWTHVHRDRAHQVSPGNLRAYEVSLADFGNRLGVAWHGGKDERSAIYFRFVAADGSPIGEPMHLTDDAREAFEPDLQALDGDPLIAWYEKKRTDQSLTALVARFDVTGNVVWKHELSPVRGNGRNPVVRVNNHEVWVAWIETRSDQEPSVWCEHFDAKGNALASARQVGMASKDTWNLNAAIDDGGRFYVVYDARLGTRANELQLIVVSDDRVVRHTLSTDDGFASKYPDIALNGSRAALTWFDYRDGNAEVYLVADSLAALAAPVDAKATRVTDTPGDSVGAYLSWNGPRIGLTWSESIGGQNEIFLRHFDASGFGLDRPRRLTNNETQSLVPAIRPWRNGFAIAWNEYESGASGVSGGQIANSSVAMVEFAD